MATTDKLLVDESPTCGIGLAQHATIPARIAVMFEGLAETLELHRTMLVKSTAEQMAAQHELPMGAHNEAAWGEAHLKAFEKFVQAQTQALALLRVAAERDERMLAAMTKRG